MSYPPCSGEDTVETTVDPLFGSGAGDGVETEFRFDGGFGLAIEALIVTIDGIKQTPVIGLNPGDFTIEADDPDILIVFEEAPGDGTTVAWQAFR